MDTRATGRDIILAIVENMRASQEPLLYSTLVASLYDVYLHRDDHERLAAVFPRVRDEAARALKEELERIQGKGRSFLPGLRPGGPKPQPVESDWQIKFHVDEDDDLKPGDIMVDSRLTMPLQPEYGTGSKTQRMVTVRSGGETKRLRSFEETDPKPAARPIARLVYLDKEGRRQEYLMTSPEIAIGRGGRNEFCDLQVDGPVDISRQHFYLRRDEETREFFIQDVSRFGTMVDGKKLAQREWVPIPSRARIKLADKVVIEFEGL